MVDARAGVSVQFGCLPICMFDTFINVPLDETTDWKALWVLCFMLVTHTTTLLFFFLCEGEKRTAVCFSKLDVQQRLSLTHCFYAVPSECWNTFFLRAFGDLQIKSSHKGNIDLRRKPTKLPEPGNQALHSASIVLVGIGFCLSFY